MSFRVDKPVTAEVIFSTADKPTYSRFYDSEDGVVELPREVHEWVTELMIIIMARDGGMVEVSGFHINGCFEKRKLYSISLYKLTYPLRKSSFICLFYYDPLSA